MSSIFAPLKSTPRTGMFAPLRSNPVVITAKPQNRVLYLSGRVELLSLTCGERLWFGLYSDFYRRLDSEVYLWLFNRFWRHFEANGLSEDTPHVPNQFAMVKRQGIEFGAEHVMELALHQAA